MHPALQLAGKVILGGLAFTAVYQSQLYALWFQYLVAAVAAVLAAAYGFSRSSLSSSGQSVSQCHHSAILTACTVVQYRPLPMKQCLLIGSQQHVKILACCMSGIVEHEQCSASMFSRHCCSAGSFADMPTLIRVSFCYIDVTPWHMVWHLLQVSNRGPASSKQLLGVASSAL